MFNFDGSTGGSRVNLGGRVGGRNQRARGGGDESKAEFVKRQHKEREARELRRIQDRAATVIQAVYRRHRCLKHARQAQRQVFDKRNGDIVKATAVLPADVTAKFVFKAIVPLLRLFAFIFVRSEDDGRLSSMLHLVLLSAAQPAACNLFHLSFADEPQRRSMLALLEKLLGALVLTGRSADLASVLLAMQASLFSPGPEYRPVDAGKSGAAVAHVLKRTKALAALSRDLLPQARGHPKAADLTAFLCSGLEAIDAQDVRGANLAGLLSAPALAEFLCQAPKTLHRECLQRLVALAEGTPMPDLASGRAVALAEEIDGAARHAWLVGNLLTLLERYVLPGGNVQNVPTWLSWISQVKNLANTSDTRLAKELERLNRAGFVRTLLSGLDRGSPEGLLAVCQLYFSAPEKGSVAECDPPNEVLQTLAFATPLAEMLFPTLRPLLGRNEAVFQELGFPRMASSEAMRLRVFCTVYALQLQPMYDYEFFGEANPLKLEEVRLLIPFLNRLTFHFVTNWPDTAVLAPGAKALRGSLSSLLSLLYHRHRRRPILTSDSAWIIPESRLLLRRAPVVDLGADADDADMAAADAAEEPMEGVEEEEEEEAQMEDVRSHAGRSATASSQPATAQSGAEQALEAVLEECPHVLPFEDRVALLHNVILADQDQRRDTRGPWAQGLMQRHQIRRNFLVEDGYAAFEALGEDGQLRDVFRVEFIAPDGQPESGVDGGGLFKEFMIHVCRTMFDPEFGLFSATSDQTLYPAVSQKVAAQSAGLFAFLGKVVGKAIYEMFLLEAQFSRVFLNRLLGRANEVDDVAALDKELHKNMLCIKESENVEDLGLTFSVSLASGQEIDLIPNGRNTPVTKENLTRYFHLMANYKTNIQFQRQATAFLTGLKCVLPAAWLRMFDAVELNMLISGSQSGFDVRDLRSNTVYSGGYQDDSPVAQWLWHFLEHEASPEDMGRFLMFITSCSRAPLLGFKNLYPKFCIHRVPDCERLPTASTCANLLKLPDYTSPESLKLKLTQAIRAEAGFDLS